MNGIWEECMHHSSVQCPFLYSVIVNVGNNYSDLNRKGTRHSQ